MSSPTSRSVLPSDAVPTSWLDPLLTGPEAVLKGTGPWGCPDIEALLRAVRARVKSTESENRTLMDEMKHLPNAQHQAAPSAERPHIHRCMSCDQSWFCPHPPADCKAGESVLPTLALRGPNGVALFDHICQRKK